jgi:hypothetical protein
VLLYLLLAEPRLALCCLSVVMGEGSPGDGVAVMLLALRAIIAIVGHCVGYHSIYYFIAGNADMAQELSVFD